MKDDDSDGAFAALGRAADESLEIATLIRAGTLTRQRFDAWYTKRRAEGTGLVITLRQKVTDLAAPFETVITQGEGMLSSAAPRPARHPAHRRRTAHTAAKDALRNAARKSKPK
jgi:hypothetical protein